MATTTIDTLGYRSPRRSPAMQASTGVTRFVCRARAVRVGVLLIAAALAAIVTVIGYRLALRALASTPPAVSPLDVYSLFYDNTPVSFTTTALWQRVPTVAARGALLSDATLWRRMRLDDWNTVPMPLRHHGLDAMFDRYRGLLDNPRRWDRMTAYDWDRVPHPVRVAADRHMADYWRGYYELGSAYRIPRRTIADALTTLLMSESWFEHRAMNVNASGNRDLGLAQASDCTRVRMSALYDAGVVDARFDEADYFNPWKATRFAAIWLGLLLDEVRGDLGAAIRAYHTGSARALAGDGQAYQALVQYRMHRYIRNHGAPDAWSYMWHLDRKLTGRSSPAAGAATFSDSTTAPAISCPSSVTPAGRFGWSSAGADVGTRVEPNYCKPACSARRRARRGESCIGATAPGWAGRWRGGGCSGSS